jgi:hypothetical protein
MTRQRPILFSGPLVRAILDGRKTQTRRAVRGTADHHVSHVGWLDGEPAGPGWYLQEIPHIRHCDTLIRCPHGVVGDRLWVRESFAPSPDHPDAEHLLYRADGRDFGDGRLLTNGFDVDGIRWRPAIHMPRWASRITLEITAVRVERLQAITEEDARAEGADGTAPIPAKINGKPGAMHCFGPDASVKAFRFLWDSINHARAAWSANPWVWVLMFRRLEPTQ